MGTQGSKVSPEGESKFKIHDEVWTINNKNKQGEFMEHFSMDVNKDDKLFKEKYGNNFREELYDSMWFVNTIIPIPTSDGYQYHLHRKIPVYDIDDEGKEFVIGYINQYLKNVDESDLVTPEERKDKMPTIGEYLDKVKKNRQTGGYKKRKSNKKRKNTRKQKRKKSSKNNKRNKRRCSNSKRNRK